MRIETDSLGAKEIPGDVYWGIHTERARENFSISPMRVPFRLIQAIASVKKAACLTNRQLGFMAEEKAAAIVSACDEILGGGLRDQFPLDALQGGAGTSTNMNVNEVIANRALEILGRARGDYAFLHPIEDVNLHQSTNDVYPTAVKVAAIGMLRELSREIENLQGVFQGKEKEFAEVIKIGRTELQEAVPVTMGAEFSAFAEALGRDRWRTFKCEERLRVVNLGGTAVGTGLGAPQRYIFLATEKLRELTGLGLSRGENLMDSTANADPFVEVSGILKAHAGNLVKIAGDLRMMALLGEIVLPELQAGSSIMPGKINPVVLEAVIQTGLKVMANDFLIAEAASRGTFQISEFMPLLALALLESLEILSRVNRTFAGFAAALRAEAQACCGMVDRAAAIVTAFIPKIGYDKAGELLKEFERSGQKNLRAFLEEKLGAAAVRETLSARNLMSLGYREHAKNA
jgi:aspartate ammonia-lyase